MIGPRFPYLGEGPMGHVANNLNASGLSGNRKSVRADSHLRRFRRAQTVRNEPRFRRSGAGTGEGRRGSVVSGGAGGSSAPPQTVKATAFSTAPSMSGPEPDMSSNRYRERADGSSGVFAAGAWVGYEWRGTGTRTPETGSRA